MLGAEPRHLAITANTLANPEHIRNIVVMGKKAEFALQESPLRADEWWAASSKVEAPHHLGHRERLRHRAAQGLGALPDYELLELFLFRSLPQGDVKPLAKALLDRFGGLAGVLGAPAEALKTVKGVGASVALDLKLLQEAALRIGRGEVAKRPVISSWSALLAYVKTALAHEPREQFRVLFLDKKNQLIVADQLVGLVEEQDAEGLPRLSGEACPQIGVDRRPAGQQRSLAHLERKHPAGRVSEQREVEGERRIHHLAQLRLRRAEHPRQAAETVQQRVGNAADGLAPDGPRQDQRQGIGLGQRVQAVLDSPPAKV
jgi:DNA repair protein RadC